MLCFFRYLCTADTKLPYAYEQCTSKEMLWQAVKQGRIFIHIFAFVLNKQELNLTHRRQNLAFHDALSIRDTRFYHQTWLCSFVLCSLQESAPSTSLSLMTSVGAWWNDAGKARRRSAFSSESFNRFLKAFTSDSRSIQRTGYTTGNHDAMASADCNSVCQFVSWSPEHSTNATSQMTLKQPLLTRQTVSTVFNIDVPIFPCSVFYNHMIVMFFLTFTLFFCRF